MNRNCNWNQGKNTRTTTITTTNTNNDYQYDYMIIIDRLMSMEWFWNWSKWMDVWFVQCSCGINWRKRYDVSIWLLTDPLDHTTTEQISKFKSNSKTSDLNSSTVHFQTFAITCRSCIFKVDMKPFSYRLSLGESRTWSDLVNSLLFYIFAACSGLGYLFSTLSALQHSNFTHTFPTQLNLCSHSSWLSKTFELYIFYINIYFL